MSTQTAHSADHVWPQSPRDERLFAELEIRDENNRIIATGLIYTDPSSQSDTNEENQPIVDGPPTDSEIDIHIVPLDNQRMIRLHSASDCIVIFLTMIRRSIILMCEDDRWLVHADLNIMCLFLDRYISAAGVGGTISVGFETVV